MTDPAVPAGPTPTDYLKKPYKLLRPGADATITDGDGNGAFHYLVQSDIFKRPASPEEEFFFRPRRPPSPVDDPSMTMEGIIGSLQAAGAEVNLQNRDGETALHVLCKRARSDRELDEKLCERLCEAGADLNIRDHQGRSAAFSLVLAAPFISEQNDFGERLCQSISRLGGRFDIHDNDGRTVLHCLLSSGCGVRSSMVKALARHGVDLSAADDEGNTMWHAAVAHLDSQAQGDKELSNVLLRLGADPEKPNKLGRNPLHGLSSRSAPVVPWRMTVFPACIPDVKTTAFDRMLQIYVEAGYDLDCRDDQGVTPLHLVCTFSEYQARRLLEAGADPKIPTHQGLTTLHLAARCRQANIIGLLLEKLKRDECGSDGGSSSVIHEIVNAKDVKGRSALYYACVSGRADSVALLLDAGASTDCDQYGGSVWEACAEFEEEQLSWSSSPPARGGRMTACSVLLEDKKRTAPEKTPGFHREHLGDVLRLLLQRQDDPEATCGYLEEAISAAATKQLDYTVWCLVEARKSLGLSLEPGTAMVMLDEPTSACLARYDALGANEAPTLSPQALSAEFKRLMGLRRLDLVQRLLLEHGWGEVDWVGNTLIHVLVRNGFVSVLRGLTSLVKELSAKLEDMEWCAKQVSTSAKPFLIEGIPEKLGRSYVKWTAQPLLVVACQSTEPNMDMVRFLVDEIGCGVDTQGYVRSRIPNSPKAYGLWKDETPIHALVRGNTNWWHTSQALPYLARDEQGPVLEIKDAFQSTALAVAASHAGRVTFNRAAVDTLLEFGADAGAVDLSLACESAEVTRLLLSRGAVVKPANIHAAVRSRNCDVLNLLLSGGGDVNAREIPITEVDQSQQPPIYVQATRPPRELWPITTEFEKRIQGDPVTPSTDRESIATPGPFVPEEHMYPLDLAAHLYSRQPELDEMMWIGDEVPCKRELPAHELEKVIETLVARGADVSATYTFPDGAIMSIKDRIVLRGRGFRIPPRNMDRPGRARKILELCKTSHDWET